MTDAVLMRASPGMAGYAAGTVTPSGQGYLLVVQPSRPTTDRLPSQFSVDVDPVLEWLCAHLVPDVSTNSGSMVMIQTKITIRQEGTLGDGRTLDVLDISEMVACIRAALSLQIKEVAAIVGVERTTVYAWLQGKSAPFEQNRNQLKKLFSVARQWQRLSSRPMGKWVRYSNPDGESILGLLSQATVPKSLLHALMRSLAKKVTLEEPIKSTAKKFADKHDIDLSQVPDQSEQVDTITGRRLSEE